MSQFLLPNPITKEAVGELREAVLTQMLDQIHTVLETDDGYTMNFGRQADCIDLLVAFIKIERVCQPFLRMALISESNGGPVKLEVAGPTGTKDFMQAEYGLRRWLDT